MYNPDDIVDKVINNPDKVVDLSEKEIEVCLKGVTKIIKNEKALLKLEGNVAFVGDTHGDFATTKAIIKRFSKMDHLIFLGDYIDRAPMLWGSIYNITYLLLLKYRYPKKIILLKGNHEANSIISCYPYEFEEELKHKFGSLSLHKKFEEIFIEMPLMVLARNVYGAHGGILKGFNREKLEKIQKNDKETIVSIVWSDPIISNTYRGAGKPFNEKELIEFLDKIKAKVFIRGHDYETLGVSIYGNRCLTIFSSSSYKEMGNQGILVAKAEKDIFNVKDLTIEDYSIGKWIEYKIATH